MSTNRLSCGVSQCSGQDVEVRCRDRHRHGVKVQGEGSISGVFIFRASSPVVGESWNKWG